jgi:integrase
VESKTTLEAYIDSWKQGLQVARSTRDHYEVNIRRHIVPALGRRPLNTLRRTDITGFVALLVEKELAPTTVESIYNLLAMILRAAVYDRLIPASPCFRIKLPPQPPRRLAAFTPAEVALMFESVRPHHRAMLAVAVGTGMRQGEILTPSGGAPYLTTQLKTPSSRRLVPLPQFTVDALSHHLAIHGSRDDGVIFRNPHGGLWRRGAINSCFWKPTLLRAGLPISYGMHSLRHTYASGLIAEGLHPRVIQARLGHTSIVETMDTYGHLFPDQNAETTAALDRLYGGPAISSTPVEL